MGRLERVAAETGGAVGIDFYVWYEPWPVTGAEARTKLDQGDGSDYRAFIPHPNVAAYRTALLDRYPFGERGDPVEGARWKWLPDESDRLVSLSMLTSTHEAVFDYMFALAEQMGLIVLDPQDNSVYLPGPPVPTLHLFVGSGARFREPEPDVVVYQVRKALTRGEFVVLQTEPERFVQAKVGIGPGRDEPGYAVEYRDGSAEAHFRYETADIDTALEVFEAYARHDETYRTRWPWRLR